MMAVSARALPKMMPPRRMARRTSRPRARFSSDARDAMSGPLAEALQQLFAGLPDVARAHGDDQTFRLRHARDGLRRVVDGGNVFGGAVAKGADLFGDAFAAYALDGLLRRRINIQHVDHVGQMKRAAEVVEQMLGAGVAVRLENRDHAMEVALAGGGERGADLGGVVAVIVDDRDAVHFAAL